MTQKRIEVAQLDRMDRAILRILQLEGRLPNADLAERVNLSASACHRRVARLEEKGVIASYAALLNQRAVGRASTVFVEITLQGQTTQMLEAFETHVARIPDLLECHLMAGAADYLLKIVARDADDFARIHREHLSRLPGVAQMHSSFSLKEVARTTALTLD
jgi:Lrp/AsnC family leucine-responsive transcriptional regulator